MRLRTQQWREVSNIRGHVTDAQKALDELEREVAGTVAEVEEMESLALNFAKAANRTPKQKNQSAAGTAAAFAPDSGNEESIKDLVDLYSYLHDIQHLYMDIGASDEAKDIAQPLEESRRPSKEQALRKIRAIDLYLKETLGWGEGFDFYTTPHTEFTHQAESEFKNFLNEKEKNSATDENKYWMFDIYSDIGDYLKRRTNENWRTAGDLTGAFLRLKTTNEKQDALNELERLQNKWKTLDPKKRYAGPWRGVLNWPHYLRDDVHNMIYGDATKQVRELRIKQRGPEALENIKRLILIARNTSTDTAITTPKTAPRKAGQSGFVEIFKV